MDFKNTCFLLRKKRFILFTFSEDSIYHGKERVVNLDTSHKRQLMQEKERQKVGEDTALRVHTAYYFSQLSSNP